jgi:hypothetical protein
MVMSETKPTGNSDPTANDVGYFTDEQELSELIENNRASDTKQSSTIGDAMAIVDAFAAKREAGSWPSLARAMVAQRLGQLVTDPSVSVCAQSDAYNACGARSLRQAGLNLCGPATFFQMALGRDPVAIMQFATDLFDKGTASIGSLSISPGQDLLDADYGTMSRKGDPSSMAEWMMFGALRNSTDVFWQGSWQGDPSQEMAGLTRPEELADWMTKSGIWSSVEDHGKWASNPGIPNAMDLKPWEGTDIALLIHMNLIAKSTVIKSKPTMFAKPDDNILMRQFPNHWVVLLNEIVADVKQENVGFTIWTWGGTMVLSAPKQVFLDNYFGGVIAKL